MFHQTPMCESDKYIRLILTIYRPIIQGHMLLERKSKSLQLKFVTQMYIDR
jgi:hypothetical protein